MTPQPPPISPQPNPNQTNQAKPSGCSRGCLVALAVAGGLMIIVLVISGIVIWQAAQSENGQKVLKAIGKGASLATKGLNAPGAEEARQLGCPEAFVLDMNDMFELIEIFDTDGGMEKAKDELGPKVMLMCQGYGTLPTCDELAAAYVKVPDRTRGEFAVLVQAKNGRKECSNKYSDDGTYLGEFADGKKKKKAHKPAPDAIE
ncbi:MAG: hypothetical protein JNM17_07510 [Archangium sp.]|nr:hypothetical protein [Archangium sp.]